MATRDPRLVRKDPNAQAWSVSRYGDANGRYVDMPRKDPIHIKESRRGSFDAAAQAHHDTPTQFENQVLSHPNDYSESMRKKAQFAKNAKSWHH